MKLIVGFFYILGAVFSSQLMGEELKKTYTWYLNSPTQPELQDPNVRELRSWELSELDDTYLLPSTTPLNADVTYDWATSDNIGGAGHSKTIVVRSRATVSKLPVDFSEKRYGFNFQNWEFVDRYIFWGGSYSEGNVIAPDPWTIDAAHKNGVKIYGTIFLPELKYGGRFIDAEALIENNGAIFKKLDAIANRLNFEGWLLNLESPVLDGEVSRARKIRDLIKKYTSESPKEYIIYTPSSDSHFYFPNSNAMTDNQTYNIAPRGFTSRKDDVNIWELQSNYKSKQYILYPDEPVWNIMEGYKLKDNDTLCVIRYKAIDNFFNGTVQSGGEWKGQDYYTKRRIVYPKPAKQNPCSGTSGINIAPFGVYPDRKMTDGDISTHQYLQLAGKYVELDLGSNIDISKIRLWHYYGDGRKYKDVAVSISSSPDHANKKIVFNNDRDNSLGLGVGLDNEYIETERGLTIVPPASSGTLGVGRYVRFYSNGSNINNDNHIVETEVYTYASNYPVTTPKNIIQNRIAKSGPTSNAHYATDGIISRDLFAGLNDGPQYIDFDLGQLYDLDYIQFWHVFRDARTYRDVVVRASPEPTFTDPNMTHLLYTNDADNTFGFGGLGQYKNQYSNEYSESSSGNTVYANDRVQARYVRLYSNGSNLNSGNHYSEVKVFAKPSPKESLVSAGLLAYSKNPHADMNRITDGVMQSSSYVDLGPGKQYFEIDLKKTEKVKQLMLMRYFGDGRKYYDVLVMLSNNPEFSSPKIVFNSDVNNAHEFGKGKDSIYSESPLGKWFTLEHPYDARYIRVYSNGSTKNVYNHVVEMKVFAFQ